MNYLDFHPDTYDYYVSSHGFTSGNFKLPYNVRVVMLCAEGTMTSCPQNDMRTIISCSQEFGTHLQFLNESYNATYTQNLNERNYKLCVFSPNFNADYLVENDIIKDQHKQDFEEVFNYSQLCPDLELSDEKIHFRTGIFNVPLDYNRVYINDYTSSSTKEFKKAGTIEKIDLKSLLSKDNKAKQQGRRPFNRLEELLIYPIPSYDKKNRVGLNAKNVAGHFIIKNQEILNKSLENILSLSSVIVPNPNKYEPITENGKLSDIVKDLSNKHKNGLVTIVIAACRDNYTDDNEVHSGIPLNKFPTSKIEEFIEEKNKTIIDIIFFDTQFNTNTVISDFDYNVFQYILLIKMNINIGGSLPGMLNRPTIKYKYMNLKKVYLTNDGK